jgi:two-component system catabolic regulation response regulator CreB
VGLPDIGGFALCRELRRVRDLPVIFLTAHDAEAERILGLEIGAGRRTDGAPRRLPATHER